MAGSRPRELVLIGPVPDLPHQVVGKLLEKDTARPLYLLHRRHFLIYSNLKAHHRQLLALVLLKLWRGHDSMRSDELLI